MRSPNFEPRKGCSAPDLVILHYTGMHNGASALARLCDPQSKVSAHYLIEEDGTLFSLVDETMRAWHAGKSFWRGVLDINSHSIGIEIVNPGHEFGYRPFPEAQMRTVLSLCKEIQERYKLPPTAFLAHSDIAPMRKEDPGELFNWKMLAVHGIGLWPEFLEQDHYPLTPLDAEKLLSKIGYETGIDEAGLRAAIRAFQRHYVQTILTGDLDNQTAKTIRAIARVC